MFSVLRDTVLLPYWACQLLGNTKSFKTNPLIKSRRLNERGLHVARVVLAHRIAAARRRRMAHLLSPEDRDAFERDGFVLRRNYVPQAQFDRLLAEVRAYRGESRVMVQGDTITGKLPLNAQSLPLMPSLREVVESPAWRGLQSYIGATDCQPNLYIQSIATQFMPGVPDPQTHLHADTFHPTAKAWLFLTDITEGIPPLVYVPGSHHLTPERLAWEKRMSLEAAQSLQDHTRQGSFRISPNDLARMGLPEPRAFVVPANTLVVADTFGFHARGPSTGPSLRVEIWAMGRRRPFFGATLPPFNVPHKLGAAVGAYTIQKNAAAFEPPA